MEDDESDAVNDSKFPDGLPPRCPPIEFESHNEGLGKEEVNAPAADPRELHRDLPAAPTAGAPERPLQTTLELGRAEVRVVWHAEDRSLDHRDRGRHSRVAAAVGPNGRVLYVRCAPNDGPAPDYRVGLWVGGAFVGVHSVGGHAHLLARLRRSIPALNPRPPLPRDTRFAEPGSDSGSKFSSDHAEIMDRF